MTRLALGLATLVGVVAPAAAATVTVRSGQSIQAAIDAAPPGTRIVVRPGVYHETGATRALTVTKDGITLVGLPRRHRPVVLEQSGTQTNGIWVSPADTLDAPNAERPPCGDSGARIARFRIQGFTVRGFDEFGIFLACVDDFSIRHNDAEDNGEYAIFPVRSAHGRMTRNVAARTRTDACLYVGESEDVLVDHNRASDCQIGLQIENCRHVRMRHNRAIGNTAGIIVDVVDDRQLTVSADNEVTGNLVRDNNRPNTAGPDDETADLVPGIGIVLNGADRNLFARNRIEGHQLAGFTLTNFCIGEPVACQDPMLDIDPDPADNRIVRNRFTRNALDVIFLPGPGQGNCFAGNRPSPPTASGGPLPACD
jgi:Periplasmic copper-binding protein (NosD)